MKAIQEKKPENVSKLENLNKITNSSLANGYGGARLNAGRKPNWEKAVVKKMKARIQKHGLGVEVVNGKKQTRLEILLTVLFREGAKGNVSAIKEYLDRQVGKSKESIEMTDPEGRLFQVNITTVSNKNNDNQLGTNDKTE
jgi:hypothetical protein